jgi:flagellar basal-body rod modification protein FlgD
VIDVSGIRSFDELNAAPAKGERMELGRNQFLELMIAQLEHQDPLEPAKNEAFVAQLAQFSTLEGIEKLNGSVDSMASAMRATVTMEAAALVGRSVLVPTDRTFLRDTGLVGNVEITESSSNVRVEISDAAGAVVQRLDLGPSGLGDARFRWDGITESGTAAAPGVYLVRAFATDGEGTKEFSVELPEVVASVSLGASGIELNLAGGSTVPVTEVREIQ